MSLEAPARPRGRGIFFDRRLRHDRSNLRRVRLGCIHPCPILFVPHVALPGGFVAPCLPTKTDKLPSGSLHEIKHDGFRMMVRRDAAGVRLLTRNGHDWSARYPQISEAAGALQVRSFLIDGEAVACDADGMPVFDRLRYRRADKTVFLFAFDLLDPGWQATAFGCDHDAALGGAAGRSDRE
jgi:hypothetical protein